jgi:hypothetical protein
MGEVEQVSLQGNDLKNRSICPPVQGKVQYSIYQDICMLAIEKRFEQCRHEAACVLLVICGFICTARIPFIYQLLCAA